MIFFPNGYFKRVTEITVEYLKSNNIKGLILDVDNTLIDYYSNLADDIIDWVNLLKESKIKICILSNSNKKKKIKKVAEKLDLEYLYYGMKPLKFGFNRAKKILNLDNSEIATVGDQIFTDVFGANRMKMFSILVEPINPKDIWATVIKRPIEKIIKNKYIETREK